MFDKIEGVFSGLFKTEGTLAQKAVRGGFWVFLSFGFGKVLNFIRIIILARLLLPSDFGLMGLAMLSIGAVEVFTTTGISQALIQRKECDKEVLNTGWIIGILRGILLFVVLFFGAPYIARFFNNSLLTSILRIISITFLFSGFSNIGLILLPKELDFKRKTYFNLATSLLTTIVTITLAFILRSVWALVIGLVIGSVISLIVSYFIHPFRPRIKFNLQISKELLGYGKYIFASGVIIFLVTRGDDALVGKVLGVSTLGFYTMAYSLSNMPATSITHVISQVTFPVYSKLQDNIPKLREAYLKTLQLTAFLSIPLAGGIFVLAPEFTKIFLGEKWMPMVPAMQVLCLLGVIRSIVAISGSVFQGVGKPKLLTQVSFAQLIILAIIIYPLTVKYNILGTGMAVVIAMLLVQSWTILQTAKIINEKLMVILKVLSLPILGVLVMMVSIYLIKRYLLLQVLLSNLLLLILFGVIIYLGIIILLKRDIFFEIKKLAKLIR